MFARLRFWCIQRKYSYCRKCCLFCRCYDICLEMYEVEQSYYPWK
nr:MAG TPA: hypothetical protein [Inoviridae sp.]